MTRTKYSITHFGVNLLTFVRLIEMYPEGEYRDLGNDCVVFKHEATCDLGERWFLDDEFVDEWRVKKNE